MFMCVPVTRFLRFFPCTIFLSFCIFLVFLSLQARHLCFFPSLPPFIYCVCLCALLSLLPYCALALSLCTFYLFSEGIVDSIHSCLNLLIQFYGVLVFCFLLRLQLCLHPLAFFRHSRCPRVRAFVSVIYRRSQSRQYVKLSLRCLCCFQRLVIPFFLSPSPPCFVPVYLSRCDFFLLVFFVFR